MLLQRINPTWPLNSLRSEFDRLLGEVLEPLSSGTVWSRPFPAINMWEDGDCLHAEAEIPGVPLDEIEINVIGNELSLKGQRKCGCADNATLHRQERGTGEFSRFLTLPVAIDADKVEAVLKDGVLTIKLPKAQEARPRKIEVKTR